MLVIISDLHLTDGSISGETINAKAFRIFRNRLEDMAYDASFRTVDGINKYIPIDGIQIVLLGDILDIIRSSQWTADKNNHVRPWSDQQSYAFYERVDTITDGILKNNVDSLAELKNISEGINIPKTMETDNNGKSWSNPDRNDYTLVPVKMYYIVGNHDWFYHIPNDPVNHADIDYNAIRRKVIHALGLSNDPAYAFPHLVEGPQAPDGDPTIKTLQALFDRHSIHATHGDIFDTANCQTAQTSKNPDIRLDSSFGDGVVVEILNRIPGKVEQMLKDKKISKDTLNALVDDLREIDNVKPYTAIVFWLHDFIKKHRHNLPKGTDKDIINALADILKSFLNNKGMSRFLSTKEKLLRYIVPAMKWKIVTIDLISIFLRFRKDKIRIEQDSYALDMIAYSKKFPDARFIIAGHTHYQEMVPVNEKVVYINTGTWRTIHTIALEKNDDSFFPYKVMTYVAFYKDDKNGHERQGRLFEFWNGALDT